MHYRYIILVLSADVMTHLFCVRNINIPPPPALRRPRVKPPYIKLLSHSPKYGSSDMRVLYYSPLFFCGTSGTARARVSLLAPDGCCGLSTVVSNVRETQRQPLLATALQNHTSRKSATRHSPDCVIRWELGSSLPTTILLLKYSFTPGRYFSQL